MNWLLTALLLVNIGILGVLTVLIWKMRALQANFEAFVMPPEEGKPSRLGNFLANVAQTFASAILQTFNMAAKGEASAESRQAKAAQIEIGQDILSENAPGIAGALGMLPKSLQRKILGNPALVSAGLELMAKKGGGGNHSAHSGEPGNGKYKIVG